jgi:lysophospholipase L1-like esterase
MGADSTRQVLWRLEHGEFEHINPKLMVLMIGTNNLYTDFNGNSTDAEIAEAIKLVISKFQSKWSNLTVLLLGILPREQYFMPRIENVNSLISQFANNKTIYYENMFPCFVYASNNTMNASLYLEDRVHLNKAGYQLWYETMEPVFSKLFKV